MTDDPYEILGVSRDASVDEIKKKYRKLAMTHHPDRGGDSDLFKKISTAYDTLTNPEKREEYDNPRPQGFGFGGPGGFGFGDFGGVYHNYVPREANIDLAIDVTLEDIFFGSDRIVSYRQSVRCDSCSGTGSKEGTKTPTCRSCGGSGHTSQNTIFGSRPVICNTCGGTGYKITNKCEKCSDGYVNKINDVSIKIPKNSTVGSIIQLRGAGNHVKKHTGDLRLHVRIIPHEKYVLQGDTLFLKVECHYHQLCLGGEVEVDIFNTALRLKINSGSSVGSQLRIRGKGLNGGDIICTLQCIIPTELSTEQTTLLEQLRETYNDNERTTTES